MRVTNDQIKKYKELSKKSTDLQLPYEEENELWDLEYAGKTNTKRYKELYKKQDDADRALKEWSDYYQDIGKQILGKYASAPVTIKTSYGADINTTADYLVSQALERLSKKM